MSLNVFADIGLPNPERELIKAKIVACIADIITEQGLTQKQAAHQLGIDQPKVSALLRGHWEGYSTDRLLRFVNALNREVRIVVGSQDVEQARTLVTTS